MRDLLYRGDCAPPQMREYVCFRAADEISTLISKIEEDIDFISGLLVEPGMGENVCGMFGSTDGDVLEQLRKLTSKVLQLRNKILKSDAKEETPHDCDRAVKIMTDYICKILGCIQHPSRTDALQCPHIYTSVPTRRQEPIRTGSIDCKYKLTQLCVLVERLRDVVTKGFQKDMREPRAPGPVPSNDPLNQNQNVRLPLLDD